MVFTGVLGVHGVKNYQPGLDPASASTRIALWWQDAVCKGLGLPGNETAPFGLQVAYYAHTLHLRSAQGEDDPGVLNPEIQRLIVAWAEMCGAPQRVAQGRISAPAREAVNWVADKYGLDNRLARILATAFFREVHTYFHDRERRSAATAEVANAVARYSPKVIIAHSLGSVVAYDALWAHRHHAPVDLFLTLGSPLAMPDIIYHRLVAHEGSRRRPPGVNRWINIADPGDFIAVPPGGVKLNFQNVAADLTDAIGAFSFHKVAKYLQCGATAGVLSEHLIPN